MGKTNPSYVARKRRQARVRKNLAGVSERPRLNVFRSLNHIYAQVIDDSKGMTLVSASSLDASIRAAEVASGKGKTERAVLVWVNWWPSARWKQGLPKLSLTGAATNITVELKHWPTPRAKRG